MARDLQHNISQFTDENCIKTTIFGWCKSTSIIRVLWCTHLTYSVCCFVRVGSIFIHFFIRILSIFVHCKQNSMSKNNMVNCPFYTQDQTIQTQIIKYEKFRLWNFFNFFSLFLFDSNHKFFVFVLHSSLSRPLHSHLNTKENDIQDRAKKICVLSNRNSYISNFFPSDFHCIWLNL